MLCGPAPTAAPRRAAHRLAFSVAVALTLAGAASAAARPSPRPTPHVYVTRSQALREAFGAHTTIDRAPLLLQTDERARIESRTRRRLFERGFVVYRAHDPDGTVTGYGVITEEIGKYEPITFLVAVDPRGRVRRVVVLVYRESRGADVRRRRFLAQLDGKSLADPVRLHRDVVNVAGATLSARSITRGVRKVLASVWECVLGPRRRTDLAWRPAPLERQTSVVPGAPDDPTRPARRAEYAMGTLLEATAFGPDAPRALAAAFSEVRRLESLLSTYRPDTELRRVNREAYRRAVRVSPATFDCIARALAFARRSGGAFDPTLTRDGYRAVQLDPAARTVRFLRPGFRLDLGGIGKGFALDRAAGVLEARGVTRALLNFGGQVLALDPPPNALAWVVGVRDPRHPDRALGYYRATRTSISTTGRYERGDHVIDPATGGPARGALAATVCARSATDADALSTACQVLGAARAAPLLQGLRGAAWLLVPERPGDAPLVRAEAGAPTFVSRRPAP